MDCNTCEYGTLGNLAYNPPCEHYGCTVNEDHEISKATYQESPTIEQLAEWEWEGIYEATDGCWVESDGTCPHGCQSWLLELGIIE